MPGPFIPNFSFTRAPSIKSSISIQTSGLVTAPNRVIIVGRRAASGGTVATNALQEVSNYGDPVAVVAEMAGYYGASSEIGAMVVASINGVLNSDLANKQFPQIYCIALANNATSASLAAALDANIAVPMPFIVQPFAASDSAAMSALATFLGTINGDDRGPNGQFGSFAVMATFDTLSNATTQGLAAGATSESEGFIIPWLRDGAGSPSQTIPQLAAAYGGLCASLGRPYNPMCDILVGSILPPASASDYATTGDSGTIAAGLAAGVVPLYVDPVGGVRISRTVTAYLPGGVTASEYYDMQDWLVLYDFRANCYATSKQPQFTNVKASDQKLKDLLSALISDAKDFEALGMFQYVDKLVAYWTVTRVIGNRNAAVYGLPVNVVPGFMNKGLGLVGTDLFDSFQISA